MQISFGNDIAQKEYNEVRSVKGLEANSRAEKAYGTGKQSFVYEKANSPLFLNERTGKKDKLAEAMEGSVEDLQTKQDYMTLMSNILSEEDYAKLSKEGFDVRQMEPGETVTIVDKIKAEVAKSGKQIVGYTDTLNEATLAEAFGGNELLAKEVLTTLQTIDVPVEEETIAGIQNAWEMASSLSTPGDGTFRFMVDNDMEPEIQSFYLAKSSGAEAGIPGGAKYYAQDVAGYLAKSSDSLQGLEKQLESVIEEAGLPVNEDTKKEVQFLADQNLPITTENLERYHELASVEFPVQEATFAKAVGNALQQGKAPARANLKDTDTSLYEKAVSILNKYLNVEEIRLEMTAEVNVKLLKSGFSFDTASIEEVIAGIKQAKEEIAAQYFPEDDQAVSKYNLYQDVKQIVEEIPTLPAVTVLRSGFLEGEIPTVSVFDAEGRSAKEQFQKAGESYEALMTAPRADMGDSIRKAFQNVDAILEDNEVPVTEENRQSVRVLGYNRMELTVENIETVRQALHQVKDVVTKMTPASTLQMIRDGINPLEKNFEQLQEYFEKKSSEYQEESESYSKYLYGLEHKNQITQEERESYIGIFRMLRMIEKGDSAAVGAVVNLQSELSFSNLLAANRSRKASNMDVKIDDAFGGLKELLSNGSSISTQIDTAYLAALKETLTQTMFGEEEARAYRMEQYQALREEAVFTEGSEALLQEAGVPVTLANLQAAEGLLDGTGKPFGKLSKALEKKEEDKLFGDSLLDAMEEKDTFLEQYQTSLKEAMETTQNLTLEAESFLDVKSLQMVHKQMSIMTKAADQEEFWIPVAVEEEVLDVHMTLRHESGKMGVVDIEIPYQDGQLGAHLEASKEALLGYFVGSTSEEVMLLQQVTDIFSDWIKEETSLRMDAKLPVVEANAIAKAKRDTESEKTADTSALYRLAKGVLLAVKKALSSAT